MRSACIVVVMVGFLAPSQAWPHAEEPISVNVFGSGNGWVLRANVGIVESGNPAELICEEAFLGGESWMLGVLGEREWLTFGETVVMRTLDGCSFEPVVQLPRRPSDATVHAASGGAAFIMNGVGDDSGLWISRDRGLTFALDQRFDPDTQQTTGVRYIDADTLLVSGYSRVDNGAGLAWTVDVESGAATPLELPPDISYPYVLAATAASVLVLGRRGEQIVFWGPLDNIGANEFIASTWPTWGTLDSQGRVAWISGTDSGRGVARGELDAGGVAAWESFAAQTTGGCVEPIGEDLYLCGLSRFDEFDVLKVSPQDAVEGVLDFRQFRGVRSDCPSGSSVATVCPLVWRELAPFFGIDPDGTPDAGELLEPPSSPDVGVEPGTDVAAPPPAPRADGCCATAAPRQPLGILVVILGLFFARREPQRRLAR